jgi:cytochrome c
MKKLLKLNVLTVLAGILVLLALVVVANLMVRGLRDHPAPPVWHIRHADPARAELAVQRYGCGSCHAIPGIREATGRVGPELDRIADQTFIAGRMPNTPANLILWIRYPQHVDPETAMPTLGVSEQDARDIAAYLYSLR